MKNLKNFDPVILARNALGATILMTVLNMILVYFKIMPIFPLSMNVPTGLIVAVNTIPAEILELLKTPNDVVMFRLLWLSFALALIGLAIYSFLRSSKKPKALKIGFGVLLFDTVILVLSFAPTLSFFIEAAYHGFILYYVFKGIKSLKEKKNV